MAEAVVTGRQQNAVLGSLRRIGANSIAFANTGDTWTIPGLKVVREINLTPTTNASYGFTVSLVSGSAVITLVSGGAVTFRGGVLGL